MLTPTSRRPSLSFVVAVLALLVATGSTSYAVGLARNSVGTAQLKKNAVTSAKVKGGAVTSRTVKNNAVTGSKIATGAVTAPKIGTGAVTGLKVKDGSIGAADLAPGTLVARPQTVRTELTGGGEAVLVRAAGVRLTAFCTTSGASGATARLELEGSVTNGLSGSLTIFRVAPGETEATVSTTGPSDADQYFLSSTTSSVSTVRLTATGHVRDQSSPPLLLDLALNAHGGTSPACAFDVVVLPTR